jgi:hypothetical protein
MGQHNPLAKGQVKPSPKAATFLIVEEYTHHPIVCAKLCRNQSCEIQL